MSTTPTVPVQQQSLTRTPRAAQLEGGARFGVALAAFMAILGRDITVTGREFIAFLLQVLLQPLFFLFIFGTVLPKIGIAQQGFGALLLPGIVALTVVTTAIQGVTLPLVLDLGFAREIDDRLLAPLPVSLVAVEKVVFAAMRGLIAGVVIFPLAFLILGSEYQVRGDAIGVIIIVMILASLAGATLGLTIGTLVRPEQIGLMFALILTPLLFTGCVQYPWSSLGVLRWFQIFTLFNPLTYASEGLRYAMVPGYHGHPLTTIPLIWTLLGLTVTFLAFFIIGVRNFRRRVVN
ncbi:MAG: ABC transporter permease [Ktedonobacteraceae bacterium]